MLPAPLEATPFVAYNKVDGKVPTLIGNWVEERTLASRTGIHRLKSVCEDASQKPQSVYPTHVHKQAKTKQDTLPRTLEHDEQYLSAEWLPTTTVVYQPPSQRLGDMITYPSRPAAGPREAAEVAQLAALAQTMVPQPPGLVQDLSSTYQAAFVQHDTSRLRIGKVQMKTMDGGPVKRDANFLAETRCLTRDVADRFAHGKQAAPSSGADLDQDVPITIYSSSLAKQRYNVEHYGSRPHGSTTFGKHANFTKMVGDYTKDTSDE
eukprot:jgi/Ulvmu1/5771/UM025_0025.1